MAKKRKHHSRKMVQRDNSRHHETSAYHGAPAWSPMSEAMKPPHIKRDRRGHAIGEHYGTDHGHGMGNEPYDRPMSARAEAFSGGPHMRVMRTNNGGRGPVSEDFRNPCGLPYGAIQRDLGEGDYYSMNGYRVGDLYEQVDKTMREDAAALRTITKPTNW